MNPSTSWISDVVGKFRLRQNVIDDFPMFSRYRLMIDRSRLVERMNATCDAINADAGLPIIYDEVFVQPHELACSYVFVRNKIECRMSLAILPEGPTLIFSCFKPDHWVERVVRRFGFPLDEEREKVACEVLINPATVNDAQLQQWFTYLLSGLRGPFKPLKTMPLRTKSRAKI